MAYSRRHYRAVSPREDTPADVAWRLADNKAREKASAERRERYPVITPENFEEATDFQERRRRELLAEAGR